MFKVNNKDTRTTPLTPLNFEHYSTPCSSVYIVNFEIVIAGWDSKYSEKVLV